jgi:hypothetical protein
MASLVRRIDPVGAVQRKRFPPHFWLGDDGGEINVIIKDIGWVGMENEAYWSTLGIPDR